MGENGQKMGYPKWAPQCSAFPHEKCSLNEKSMVSPNDYGMPKTISTFPKKKSILGHFCDFGKITKVAKNVLHMHIID